MMDSVGRTAVNQMAAMAERQAKINASSGSHPHGTPTPAQKGSGPARVTGDLVRGITHTRAEQSGGRWQARVGLPGGIMHGGYAGGRGRRGNRRGKKGGGGGGAPLGVIGRALEKMDYPFLTPAVKHVTSQGRMYLRLAMERYMRSKHPAGGGDT